MAALSNDPARCEIMNLGWAHGGHGPYLVRQVGYPPGSSDMRPQPFILQRDGRWLLNLAFAALDEAEQDRQLFHDLGELSTFLDALSSREVAADATLPRDVGHDELLRRFETCTHRVLQGMRNCTTLKEGG